MKMHQEYWKETLSDAYIEQCSRLVNGELDQICKMTDVNHVERMQKKIVPKQQHRHIEVRWLQGVEHDMGRMGTKKLKTGPQERDELEKKVEETKAHKRL